MYFLGWGSGHIYISMCECIEDDTIPRYASDFFSESHEVVLFSEVFYLGMFRYSEDLSCVFVEEFIFQKSIAMYMGFVWFEFCIYRLSLVTIA